MQSSSRRSNKEMQDRNTRTRELLEFHVRSANVSLCHARARIDEAIRGADKDRLLLENMCFMRARKEKLVELARDVYKRARSDVSNYESKFVCKHEITRLGARTLVKEHW
jgi:hypothetical protein